MFYDFITKYTDVLFVEKILDYFRNYNETLTNNVVNFEQLGPGHSVNSDQTGIVSVSSF